MYNGKFHGQPKLHRTHMRRCLVRYHCIIFVRHGLFRVWKALGTDWLPINIPRNITKRKYNERLSWVDGLEDFPREQKKRKANHTVRKYGDSEKKRKTERWNLEWRLYTFTQRECLLEYSAMQIFNILVDGFIFIISFLCYGDFVGKSNLPIHWSHISDLQF